MTKALSKHMFSTKDSVVKVEKDDEEDDNEHDDSNAGDESERPKKKMKSEDTATS